MVDKDNRTFETRVKFINEVFSNKFSRSDIMTSCILFKLKNSYNNYADELEATVQQLENKIENKGAISILRRMN